MAITVEDLKTTIGEIAAIQEDGVKNLLPQHSSPEVEAYWRGRTDLAGALRMLLEHEDMIHHYVKKAEERAQSRKSPLSI